MSFSKAITPTLSLMLRESITLKTAFFAISIFPASDIELDLSNKMMTFLAPDAAIVYHGRYLGS